MELKTRLQKLEKAVPALIAWNVVQAVGADLTSVKKVHTALPYNLV